MHPIFLDFVQSYQQPAYRYWLRFQSTLPARGATGPPWSARPPQHYFNPRSPRGERLAVTDQVSHGQRIFQSTLPARGATAGGRLQRPGGRISIHAPREGSDWRLNTLPRIRLNFNPRSPRGERRFTSFSFDCALVISIHAPREGSDSTAGTSVCVMVPFQSTLPARGATIEFPLPPWVPLKISIHAPREGSDVSLRVQVIHLVISIHAPREGSDGIHTAKVAEILEFQSTLPARGATIIGAGYALFLDISIHAPREGSDPRKCNCNWQE